MSFRVLLAGLVLVLSACKGAEPPPTETFYDRKIGAILLQSCANSPTQSGCHVAKDDRGNALGNLNVTSYATLTKRTDLFIPYGAYGVPALLLKALTPFQMRLSTWDQAEPQLVKTEIPHAGGSIIDVTSTSYNEIVRWIQRGASENNSLVPPVTLTKSHCSSNIGDDPAFPSADPTSADYATFVSQVNPMLGKRCAAGNCHGSPGNVLYLTCGDSPDQARWNYFVASDYLSADAQASEILRRPLDPNSGGVYHEGGGVFESTSEPDYKALLEWAKAKGGPPVQDDPFMFFAHRVQPMLVKKGCMIVACHAPAMGHEYRLRGGSGGQFGLATTRRNYLLTLEQVALEADDVNVSRLLRKNLEPLIANSPVPQVPLGILHRGGALFGRGASAAADGGSAAAGPPACDAQQAETGDLNAQSEYCVIKRWIEIERAAKGSTLTPFSAIVYVKRPPAPGLEAPQDFGDFAPGADLMRAPATLGPQGTLTVSGGTSLLGPCGLSAGIDVRRPAVSWDGNRIAFAARTSASEPYRIYVIDGGACAVEPTIDAPPSDNPQNELVHNFDPAFAPDGRIVFASTRGNITGRFDYSGPQRTPADPSKLNSNLYVAESDGTVRQLTFLLNQELTPSFMSDGRLIMTTEKRAKGFYQLAGRRQNLDGGDYHPLFGQRATFGFHQVTDIVELADKDFATILSNRGAAHGAGALAVVNRSIGVDQQSAEPKDYVQDPNAVTWPNPEFYQHSVRVLDGVGTPGEAGLAYRNPTPLPNGKILVAAADVADVGQFSGNFDLYVVDPVTGERSGAVVTGPEDEIWPVAVYGRYDRGVFKSKLDEPNGATRVAGSGDADVTILDVPLLTSLMFQNTRSRRVIPEATDVEEWEDLPPGPGVTDYAAGGKFVVSDAFGQLYVQRRQIGSFTPRGDGSAHITVPGGVPLVLAPLVQLAGDPKPTRHHQLEEMQFYPGETVRQGFPRAFFNGMCASCHGAITGYDADIAANPDILTQASFVSAKDRDPTSTTPASGPTGPPFP